jgi:tetratricopeptide (TPR) repeat protein
VFVRSKRGWEGFCEEPEAMKRMGQNEWIRLASALIGCMVAACAQQPNDLPSHWRENIELGKQLLAKGLYQEAEKPLQAALKETEKDIHLDHRLITSLNSLAELRYEQGTYNEAETLLRRALEVGEKVLGADNLEVATTLNSLGLVDAARGQFAEADPLYRRSLAIVENALGGEWGGPLG